MDLLGTVGSRFSGLALDYIQGGAVRALFGTAPVLPSINRRLEELTTLPFDRKKIRSHLEAQNRGAGCGPVTLKHLAEIESPGAVFVTCGHQACLFGGPLFTAYKILTAVALAREVRERTGAPAIPLFWMATDDDDLKEVASARTPSGELRQVEYGSFKGSAGNLPSPLALLPGGPSIEAATWGDYHVRLLHRLMSAFGVVTADPLHPGTAGLRRGFFEAFVSELPRIREKLVGTIETLADMGFKPQVLPRKEDTFLYLRDGTGRKRWDGKGEFDPGRLLTSALSRLPSVEFSLPVLAEISGPAEAAYHAETRSFYEALGRTMPVIVPRFSATLFRPQDLAALETAGTAPEAMILEPVRAMEAIAWNGLPKTARRAVESLDEKFAALFEPVREALAEIDPTLTGAVDASERKAKSIRAYLEKKSRSAARRLLGRDQPDLLKTLDFIHPSEPQERHFNYLYFCLENPDFLDGLLRHIRPLEFNHALISL